MQQVSNSVSSETLKEATNTWTIAKDMGVRYEAEEGKMVSKIAILEEKNILPINKEGEVEREIILPFEKDTYKVGRGIVSREYPGISFILYLLTLA